MKLSETEIRVLGVLIEKSLTQPASYPLTLNAILVGSNQKQNREPVREHSEADVSKALYDLQQRNLVKHAPPSPGARANRFEHNLVERFHWDRREQAVMAELMLRGRQTAGELRTRASRMAPLSDLEAVGAVLDALRSADPPFVAELAREPGRSANRFRPLLSGDPVDEDIDSGPTDVKPSSSPPVNESPATDLANRVAKLEHRVTELAGVVDQLLQDREGAR